MKEIIVAYDNTETSPIMGEWVAELVRCGDCNFGTECLNALREKCIRCSSVASWGTHSVNFFCAFGEKKEVDNESN